MVTCQQPIAAVAAAHIPASTSARLTGTTSTAPSGTPAQITETLPNNAGVSIIIASRCKRMTFRSNEVRKRYLAVHRLFASKTCLGAGDAQSR